MHLLWPADYVNVNYKVGCEAKNCMLIAIGHLSENNLPWPNELLEHCLKLAAHEVKGICSCLAFPSSRMPARGSGNARISFFLVSHNCSRDGSKFAFVNSRYRVSGISTTANPR